MDKDFPKLNNASPALTEKIRNAGYALGFSEVRFCDAAPLTDAGKLLENWLGNRFHGTMEWMARTRRERKDPRSYYPEAKTIIVTAYNYYRENEPLERPPTDGNISIYARGRDYHKVIRKKLKILLKEIQQLVPAAQGRVCVDSFPLMEKPLAVKAGIGWIGKHSNLIIKQKGSYYFLGELLLTEELPPDPAMQADHCGTCNRCQIACPTDALSTPYVLEAQKCISYLTIEHDGEIDPQLQKGMENWVFGCDICQAVCPWNRFSTHTEERDFDNRLPDQLFNLQQLATMSETEFNDRFAGTPVRRSGYENFMRNISIARENATPEA